jgi:beta-glucosidase
MEFNSGLSIMNKNIKLSVIFIPIIAVLLAIGIVGNVLCSYYWVNISAVFYDTSGIVDEEYVMAARENSQNVNVKLEDEGAVLLKNSDDVLPLSGNKVNVYGLITANLYLNSNGSSASNASNVLTLKDGFESEGIEVNSSLWNLLVSDKAGGSSAGITEGSIGSSVKEFTLSQYENAVSWSNAKNYSEYAVVTFGRVGGEGGDLNRLTETTADYLAFTDREVELIQKLHTEGFKVILLLNTSHVMSLTPVIDYADAILWIGGPGSRGAQAVAEIISGSVSPSGRLVDTWMADQTTNSTYYTADKYRYLASDGKSEYGGYTNFNEGIYVGYKWYETAAAEGFWSTAEAKSRWGVENYEDVVVYPFGYGLSYGNLDEQILSYTYENGTFNFNIKAENLNSTPSKDVLELYVEKPYGDVESSKVELVAFTKTDLLATGVEGYESSQIINLTVTEDELASYDTTADNGNGAYVLAGGTYKFYLASGETGAHIWASVNNEKRCIAHELAKKVYSDETGARSSDETAAQNVFDEDSNAMAIDDDNAGYKPLSRANGFSNAFGTVFPEEKGGVLFGDITLTSNDKMYERLVTKKTEYGEYKGEILDNLMLEQNKKYTLADMYTFDSDGNKLYEYVDGKKVVLGSVDYDDERWDYLISQMSLTELQRLIGRCGWGTPAIESIGKDENVDYDGPFGLSNLMTATLGFENTCVSFCSETVSASTWNTELLEEFGKAVAKEANGNGTLGWYAPGANIHRTPYGGRNAEYFSEDSYLSGLMCAYEVSGAMSGGLCCYAKHFAFNDLESNRTTLENCWMNEQTAREIYLKPFEIAVKQGNLSGIMASYMWICGQWGGGNYNLITNIVRNEWGYKGTVTTDNASPVSFITAAQVLYAGGDMLLSSSTLKLPSTIAGSDEAISAYKISAKRILYMVASAELNREVASDTGFNRFIPLYIVANIVIYGAALALGTVYVVKIVRYNVRKKKNVYSELTDAQDNDGQM